MNLQKINKIIGRLPRIFLPKNVLSPGFFWLFFALLPLHAEFIEYEEFKEFDEFASIEKDVEEVLVLEHPVEEQVEESITQFPREEIIALQENRDALIALVNTFSENEYEVVKTEEGYFFVREDQMVPAPLYSAVEKYLKKGGTAIDYGAGNGLWTVAMSEWVGPQGKVIAFEDKQDLFKEMFWNLILNHIQNAQMFCTTLEEKEKTLDNMGLDNVSLIRINAEGREDLFLKGAAKTIQEQKPVLIINMLGGIPPVWFDRYIKESYEQRFKLIHAMGYRTEKMESGEYLALPLFH